MGAAGSHKNTRSKANMKQRFVDRVETERKILRFVNGTCRQPSLNGLSKAAISAWAVANPYATKAVVEILVGLARRVQIECDVSRDVFDDKEEVKLDSIDDYLAVLEQMLRRAESGAA